MANTTEMVRLMRHAADLLDACDPGANAAVISERVPDSTARCEAVERATAEAVAMGLAAMVLRMVAADLRAELIQVVAVAVAWVEALDRRARP